MSAPSLSVSIVVYDLDHDTLDACLASLTSAVDHSLAQGHLSDWHLTLVDNGDNAAALKPYTRDHITLISNDQNVGFGAAHNQVISVARSDLHLVLNPDVVLEKDSISAFLGHFAGQPGTVLAGPRGFTSGGHPAYLCKRYPAAFDLLLRGFAPRVFHDLFEQRLSRYEYRDLDETTPASVELLSGCCMLARTPVIQRINGFDAAYFLYFEDFDLSRRMAEHGDVTHLPAARILHHGGNSAKKGAWHIRHFCWSAIRFYRTHGWKLI